MEIRVITPSRVKGGEILGSRKYLEIFGNSFKGLRTKHISRHCRKHQQIKKY